MRIYLFVVVSVCLGEKARERKKKTGGEGECNMSLYVCMPYLYGESLRYHSSEVLHWLFWSLPLILPSQRTLRKRETGTERERRLFRPMIKKYIVKKANKTDSKKIK